MIRNLFSKVLPSSSSKTELLFITGSGRTGTSTLVGMLNCSPEICQLFEINANHATLGKRDRQLVERHPAVQKIFGSKPPFQAFADLAEYFAGLGYRYRYFGSKIPSPNLTEEEFEALSNFKILFLVRDIRSWLCKNNNVRGWKLEQEDATGLAIEVGTQFLKSFTFPKSLRLSMESLILQNDLAIDRIGNFLGLDLRDDLKEWWNKVGQGEPSDPKVAVNWWSGHDSSKLRPTALDTQATLKSHPFWDSYLPVFDKYYNNLDGSFSASEIAADIQKLESCAAFAPASVPDLFESVSSVSFGSGEDGAKGHRSTNEGLKPFSM